MVLYLKLGCNSKGHFKDQVSGVNIQGDEVVQVKLEQLTRNIEWGLTRQQILFTTGREYVNYLQGLTEANTITCTPPSSGVGLIGPFSSGFSDGFQK